MATKFVNEKWEKVNFNKCECEQLTKFCSLMMKEKIVENVNTDSSKVNESYSIEDTSNSISHSVIANESNKIEYTISEYVECETSCSQGNNNGR